MFQFTRFALAYLFIFILTLGGETIELVKHHNGGIFGCGSDGDDDENHDHQDKEIDPFEGVPASVVKALNIFFPAVLSELLNHFDKVYESFVCPAMGTMCHAPEERIVISLHNDDWHTYEQVIAMVREIKQCTRDAALQLTTQVDKLGALPVFNGTYGEAISKGFINNNGHTRQLMYLTPRQKNERKKRKKSSKKQTKLQDSTLLYSVQPLNVWIRTNRILGMIQFIDELCTQNVACRAVVSRCMASTLDQFGRVAPASPDVGEKRKGAPSSSSSGETKRDDPSTFSTTSSSSSISTSSIFSSTTAFGANTLLQRFLERDVYIPKPCVEALHTLYTHLLSSSTFKAHFGKLYVMRYPTHCWKFCMGDGTEEQSVQSLSVQIMTTPSLVTSMMDHMHMSSLLISGVLLATCVAASTENPPALSEELTPKTNGHTSKISFDSWCLRHKRYSHIVYDLLYVLRVGPRNYGATRFVMDSPTYLAGWMTVLAHWCGRSRIQRQEGNHVAFEDQNWVTTFNMFMQLKRISKILSRAIAHVDVIQDGVPHAAQHNDDGGGGGSSSSTASSAETMRMNRKRTMNEELNIISTMLKRNSSLSHFQAGGSARGGDEGGGRDAAARELEWLDGPCSCSQQ